ncbi:MAG: RecQ family ATP-dependent DNA helicase [Saprospiraceae bacterium]|nr:RecQ family ATP-dependent DNA helicase [Saprospiraceae bacterium]
MDIQDTLYKYYGYKGFRHNQEQIVNSILSGTDVVALMPTGGGKSICFQLPFLHLQSQCLVISPLIALMEDQVGNMRRKGIPAFLLHSGLSQEARNNQLSQFLEAPASILYVSPERLKSPSFISTIRSVKLSHIAIDEAHCISQWGHDFRPSYLEIANFIKKLIHRPQITALTATATPLIIKEVIEFCNMENPQIVKASLARKNIEINVIQSGNPKMALLNKLKTSNDGSNIVYLRSRRGVKSLQESISSFGKVAYYYHGNMSYGDRNLVAEQWSGSPGSTMVATNAFGMGIDKSDVRMVFHLDIPPSIEEYYQEIGRAGRDGKISQTYILLQPKAEHLTLKKLKASFLNQEQVTYLSTSFDELYRNNGITRIEPFTLRERCKEYKMTSLQLLNALNILEKSGCLTMSKGIKDPSRIMLSDSVADTSNKEKLKEKAHLILDHLLKNYEHLFDSHVVVSEEMICRHLNISIQELYDNLNELSNAGYLFFQKRNDKPWVEITGKVPHGLYYKYVVPIQQSRLRSLEEMINLIQTKECRMKQILEYFGETDSDNCSICDQCQTDELPEILENSFVKMFNSMKTGHSFNLIESLKYIERDQKRKILTNLQMLADEEIISIKNGEITLLKPHKINIPNA